MVGVTSEGSTSHLHRCVCPYMVPEECSLPNSLHLFAFFTLHSPPEVLHRCRGSIKGYETSRDLKVPES